MLSRDFERCSIGYYANSRVGRPSENCSKTYVQVCNFVFSVEAKVESLNLLGGSVDPNSGWIVKIDMKDKKGIFVYIQNECAASNTMLRKIFLKCLSGVVCRLKNDYFWSFVDYDLCNRSIRTCYVAPHCGKIMISDSSGQKKYYWGFPEIILDWSGHRMENQDLLISIDALQKRVNGDKISLPSSFPIPLALNEKNEARMLSVLKRLGFCLSDYYGPRLGHALHILSFAIKALNRDIIMKEEHQVSVMNVSGPPNIGKTLACAIALKLLGSDSLMLSRCTPSAMLDYTELFHNMMVVWDDPRNCPLSQFASIVHEAFHGHKTTSISRGHRSYNSNLIIGTQQRLLGLPIVDSNLPTFSRLSHVDMSFNESTFTPKREYEDKLQEVLKTLNCFGLLVNISYDKSKIDKLHDKLLRKKLEIIPRSLRNIAVDWYFCQKLNEFLKVPSDVIDDYFSNFQMKYLSKYCSNYEMFQLFCIHIRNLLEEKVHIPSTIFKGNVRIDFKDIGSKDCVGIYCKEFFPFISNLTDKYTSNAYDSDTIISEVKMSKGAYGELGRNVSFKANDGGNIIRRALVVRKDVIYAKAESVIRS